LPSLRKSHGVIRAESFRRPAAFGMSVVLDRLLETLPLLGREVSRLDVSHHRSNPA
jgi:hypothetical protein